VKKNILILLLFAANFCFSQTVEKANIFLQEFHYNSLDCYTLNNNIVFFTKYYSDKELKTGNIYFNDSITISTLKHTKAKYEYYLRQEFSKDTIIGKYEPAQYSIISPLKIESEQKINFKNLQQNLVSYECDNQIYENLVFIKTFFFTSCIIYKDEKNKKYKLKLIKENCEVVYEENYDYDLQYSEQKNFLALKYRENFIFIFDKYIFK
jgi:hypothetical protein